MNHQGTKAPIFPAIESSLDEIGRLIVDSAFQVHKTFGPGLLEGIYEDCLCIAFQKRGLKFICQASLSLEFEGERLENACRGGFYS